MPFYYINEQTHEVHKDGCSYFPKNNPIYLGPFSNCTDAVSKAIGMGFHQANGCYYCSIECHTG